MKKRKVWLGPITVQGERSEDRRVFEEFQYRKMPLSLVAVTLDTGRHENAVAIGTMEAAGMASGGLHWGAGYVDADDTSLAFADKIESKSQSYVSIDGAAIEDPVTEAIDPATDKVVPSEEIYAAYVEAEDALMDDDADRYAEIMAWLDSLYYQTRYPLTQIGRVTLLTYPCFEQARIEIIGDEGDVDPVAALKEALGDGAQLAAGADPIDGPSPVAPTEARPASLTITRMVAGGAPAPSVTLRSTYQHAGPIPMPAEFYELPDLPAPVPFTVEANGHMHGHVATDSVCHRSWGDQCVLMPDSDDLDQFAVGQTLLDNGVTIATGVITYGGMHAPDEVGDLAEEIHRRMEDLGCQLGTLAIRRDRWGLQVAGAVHMDVPRSDLNRVIAAAPSGDWRDHLFFDQRWQRGELALFGIHMVTTPGFLPPKRQKAAAGLRLVASAGNAPGCACGGGGSEPCGCRGASASTEAERLLALAQLDQAHALRSR